MKIYLLLFLEFLRVIAKLLRPGGPRAIAAENLLLKQQLIVHSRSRKRAPKLSVVDRALFGFWTGFLNPRRLVRAAIVIKPATLLKFHAALVKWPFLVDHTGSHQRLFMERRPFSVRIHLAEKPLGYGGHGSVH